MGQGTQRLERLVAEEQAEGTCCDDDIERRIGKLEDYVAEIPSDAERDRSAFTALGNETRYTIVRLLVSAGRELCVCEITPILEVSDSAVSHALSDLSDAGLVTRRNDGTWRYYHATERAGAMLAAVDRTRESVK